MPLGWLPSVGLWFNNLLLLVVLVVLVVLVKCRVFSRKIILVLKLRSGDDIN